MFKKILNTFLFEIIIDIFFLLYLIFKYFINLIKKYTF